jgi:hypothetical protein
MINALKFVISCECLGLETSFQGSYFGHVFSKACQYDSADEKICKNLKYVFVKSTQIDLQKCITWPKNLGRVGKSGRMLVLKLIYAQEN